MLVVVVCADLAALLPALSEARHAWLTQAATGALLISDAPDTAKPTIDGGRATLDLSHEGTVAGLSAALSAVVAAPQGPLIVTAAGWTHGVAVASRPLTLALRRYVLWFLLDSLPLLALAGVLLVAAMRAASHAEHQLSGDPDAGKRTAQPDLQQEAQTAQWREARLAALSTAVGRASHDLRGVLSPALLTAERLQMSGDPAIKHGADVLIRAIEKAADVMKQCVGQVREYPVLPGKAQQRLRPLIEQAAEQTRTAYPTLAVENAVSDDYDVDADRDRLVLAVTLLLRSGGDASARRVRVSADLEANEVLITISDDGSGLSDALATAPFLPFAGANGMRLATARELIRAHGGDVSVLETGPDGTSFRLVLPAPRPTAAAAWRAAAGG